jgi:hypothetical protein
MWTHWKPPGLHNERGDFTDSRTYAGQGLWDLILFDPPYVAKGGAATKASVAEMDDRYGRTARPDDRKTAITPTEVKAMMTIGMTVLAGVVRPGGMLWVKSADYVTSGAVQWGNHDVRCHGRDLGLVQVDEFHLRATGPQPRGRRQVHARRGFSTLTVWRKPRTPKPL